MASKPRKTIQIEAVIGKANSLLRQSDAELVKERMGIAALLERILFDTDRYAGFTYQDSERNPDGTLKVDYDDSRRIYYYR